MFLHRPEIFDDTYKKTGLIIVIIDSYSNLK